MVIFSKFIPLPYPTDKNLAKNSGSARKKRQGTRFFKILHYNSGSLAAISSGVISVSTTEWTVASVRLEYISARF